MPSYEVFRYNDARGDTVVFKLDPSLLDSSYIPSPASFLPASRVEPPVPAPDNDRDGPLAVYHEWRYDTHDTIHLCSLLLDRKGALERYRKDRVPAVGKLLWEGMVGEKNVIVRFGGWERGGRGVVIEMGKGVRVEQGLWGSDG